MTLSTKGLRKGVADVHPTGLLLKNPSHRMGPFCIPGQDLQSRVQDWQEEERQGAWLAILNKQKKMALLT